MRDSLRNASWIDLLIRWIDALPIPVWVFYLGLFALVAVLNTLAFRVDPDSTTLQLFYSSFAVVYILAANHIIQRLAASTFDQFQPSLDLYDEQLERARNKFMMAPAWLGLVFLLLGIQSGVSQVLEEASAENFDVTIFMYVIGFIVFASTSMFTTYFMANTIRRLRLIIQFHRQVDRVDLYHLDSLRAFSRFSSTTAIMLLLTILVNSPWFIESADEIEELIFYIILSVLALVVFLVPLLGLRNKISEARDQRTNDLMADMDLIAGKISQAVRGDELERLDKLKVGMDGLMLQRDELRKLHTWPWSTSTIRAFWSAFLLPIILWLVTRILERYI